MVSCAPIPLILFAVLTQSAKTPVTRHIRFLSLTSHDILSLLPPERHYFGIFERIDSFDSKNHIVVRRRIFFTEPFSQPTQLRVVPQKR